MEFQFHVLYLTCFCGSWTAPLPNIRVCMYKGKRKFQTVYVDNKNGIELYYICVLATTVRNNNNNNNDNDNNDNNNNNNNNSNNNYYYYNHYY